MQKKKPALSSHFLVVTLYSDFLTKLKHPDRHKEKKSSPYLHNPQGPLSFKWFQCVREKVMGRWVNSLLEKNKRVEERERKTKESEVEKETVWWCQFRQKAQSWCVLAGEQRALTDSALLTIKVHTTFHTRTHILSGRHTNTPTLCVSDFKLLFPMRGHKRGKQQLG